jgi:hypothetical protein
MPGSCGACRGRTAAHGGRPAAPPRLDPNPRHRPVRSRRLVPGQSADADRARTEKAVRLGVPRQDVRLRLRHAVRQGPVRRRLADEGLPQRCDGRPDGVHLPRPGATLTGGEDLLQPAFTAAVLRRCKELGLHTALDTSGFLGARASDALLADTDLVLLDVKSFGVRAYRKLTGGDLAPTLNFATRLDRLGVPVWIRYVLVPGWTDAPAAVDGLGGFLAGLGNIDRVDVLPFHKLGAHEYDAPGIPFPLHDTPAPDPELTERVCEQFREHGLRAL